MLATYFSTQIVVTEIDVNRVPSGSGIDFIIWPIMIAAFFYIVYLTTRKQPSDKGNKDNEN